jgi:type II secretory pathway component GspD/PulD (secretin)
VLADENKRLKADAAAVIAANPAVRLLIENYDLRCENYEKQIFTLAQAGAEKDKVIDAQGVEIVQLKYNYNDMKKAWEDEHAARLVSDNLRVGLERQVSNGKIWKWVAIGTNVIWGAIAVSR